jgi:hypothetical protein
VEPDIWWKDILIFQQCFLNVLEWYSLLFFDGNSEDDSGISR